MRAIVCNAFGPVEDLRVQERSDPEPGPGQILVEVRAAGANFVDGLMVEGKYQMKPPVPYTPGGEVAGVVERCGPGVDGLVPGDRVLALTGFGAFAEKVAIPAGIALRVPDGVDLAVASTFIQAYCTADFALRRRAGLQSGESVLVLGGGGGVGLAAIDLSTALGARPLATGSTSAKRSAARAAGADATVDPLQEPLKERVRELTGGEGVDVVLDPVGGPLADSALRTLRVGGRYLVIGFASGEIPRLPLNQVLLRNRAILGVDWGAWAFAHGAEQRGLAEELLQMLAAGHLHPAVPIKEPLEHTSGVLRSFLDRQAVGKVALIP